MIKFILVQRIWKQLFFVTVVFSLMIVARGFPRSFFSIKSSACLTRSPWVGFARLHQSSIDTSSELKNKLTPAELLRLELPSNEENENLLRVRHTTAHVMAMAVQRLFPDVKCTIGPWIDSG